MPFCILPTYYGRVRLPTEHSALSAIMQRQETTPCKKTW